MAFKKHFKALLLAFVALALTVTGVVIAATNSNSGASSTDPLSLHGYPPKTAKLSLTVNDGKGFGITSTMQVNFRKNTFEANVLIPIAVASADINILGVGDHLYLRSGAASSGPWFGFKAMIPALFGLSLELTKPDVSLVHGFQGEALVKTSGPYTTYIFSKKDVLLGNNVARGVATYSKDSTPEFGTETISITVGASGEATGASASFATKHSHTTLTVKVLSYNTPVSLTKPAKKDVTPISKKYIQSLLKSETGKNFVFPTSLGSLANTSVS